MTVGIGSASRLGTAAGSSSAGFAASSSDSFAASQSGAISTADTKSRACSKKKSSELDSSKVFLPNFKYTNFSPKYFSLTPFHVHKYDFLIFLLMK